MRLSEFFVEHDAKVIESWWSCRDEELPNAANLEILQGTGTHDSGYSLVSKGSVVNKWVLLQVSGSLGGMGLASPWTEFFFVQEVENREKRLFLTPQEVLYINLHPEEYQDYQISNVFGGSPRMITFGNIWLGGFPENLKFAVCRTGMSFNFMYYERINNG